MHNLPIKFIPYFFFSSKLDNWSFPWSGLKMSFYPKFRKTICFWRRGQEILLRTWNFLTSKTTDSCSWSNDVFYSEKGRNFNWLSNAWDHIRLPPSWQDTKSFLTFTEVILKNRYFLLHGHFFLEVHCSANCLNY